MKKSSLFLLTFLAGAFLPSAVSAAGTDSESDDMGTWCYVTLSGKYKSLYGDLRVEHRSQDMARELDCMFVRPTIGYRINDWLKVEACYYYISKTESIHHRFMLGTGASLKEGGMTFSITGRWQYNYDTQNSQVTNTLRSKIQTSYQIPQTHFKPYASVELFTWEHWKETRHQAGSNISLGDRLTLDIFYQYRLREGKPQEHVAGLGLNIKL